MDEIVFIGNSDQNILAMNEAGKHFFGFQDPISDSTFNFIQLFDNHSIDLIKSKMAHLNHSNKPIDMPVEIKNSKGRFHGKLKLSISAIDSNQFIYFGTIAIHRDGFFAKDELFKNYDFIDNLPLGIYRTTIDGQVLFANKELLNIFGFENFDDFFRINIDELFVENQERKELIQNCLINKNGSFEFQAYRKDKTIIWIKDSCYVVLDSNGSPRYLDGIIEDITKKRVSEQKLIESEQKLKESNLSKDKFMSIISHDLRGPFNQIIGATELLLSKIDEYDKEMIEKFLALLNEETTQSYRLLENLLEWSKNQRGLINFNPGPQHVYSLVHDVLSILDPYAIKKKITIDVHISKDLYIYADKDMISTILRNLISNAIKFTEESGSVIIKAMEKIDSANYDTFIEFSVADNGTGMTHEMIDKLFKLTENYSAKGTYNESGTGLGLILCKEFIEKHNGKIWVESELGKGSIFSFTIH